MVLSFTNLLKPYFNIPQNRSISYWSVRSWYAKLWKVKPGKPPYDHVVQIGDPKLRTKCKEIPLDQIKSNEIRALIDRMKYVMRKYRAVGISAPQIGVNLRLFLMEFNKNHLKGYTDDEIRVKEITTLPLTVFINPELKITDYAKVTFPESCESVKGFWADVPRYRSLELKGYDGNGDRIGMEAEGWIARIIQHEMDHLDGKIYTDIMKRDSLTCSCWEAVNENRGKIVLPFSPH